MFRKLVQRFVSSKYTQALEAEVARLRAENRALLNSILGIAGVPPITVVPDSPPLGARSATAEPRHAAPDGVPQPASRVKTNAPNGNARDVNGVTPMRRRSWHQIYRMLEIDSARKKPNHFDGPASAGKAQQGATIPPATTRS